MKKIALLSGIILMFVSVMFAQPHTGGQQGKEANTEAVAPDCGPGHCLNMLPGLTEDQKKQIMAKGMAFHKELALIDAQIDEKKAHLKVLEIAEAPDMAAIGKTIDEMMVLKGDIMKKKIAHHQEIRKMLNDEQKMIFDQHMSKNCGGKKCKGKCGGMGMGSGCGNMGMGSCCGNMGMGQNCGGMNHGKNCCPGGEMKTGCTGQGMQPGTSTGCKGMPK